MSQYSIPEIITYEDDDYVISSILNGVATATSPTKENVKIPLGDNILGAAKVVYNSYTSLEFADVYHSRRLDNEIWRSDTTSEDTRISALYWATDILNRQSWVGQSTNYHQAMSWPRLWVPNRNYTLKGGVEDLALIDISTTLTESPHYVANDTIPPFLMDATAELALYLIKRSATSVDEVSKYSDQLASLSLGSVSLNFRGDSQVSTTDMPEQVYQLIRDYLNKVKELDRDVQVISTVTLRRN